MSQGEKKITEEMLQEKNISAKAIESNFFVDRMPQIC